jgi:hypothetical protein
MLGQLGDRVSLGPNIRKLITGYFVGEEWVVPVAADALDAIGKFHAGAQDLTTSAINCALFPLIGFPDIVRSAPPQISRQTSPPAGAESTGERHRVQ